MDPSRHTPTLMRVGSTRSVITNVQALCAAHTHLNMTPGSLADALGKALGMDCRLDCADFHLLIQGLPSQEEVQAAFKACVASHT